MPYDVFLRTENNVLTNSRSDTVHHDQIDGSLALKLGILMLSGAVLKELPVSTYSSVYIRSWFLSQAGFRRYPSETDKNSQHVLSFH